MIKRLILAAAVTVALAGASFAQDKPAEADAAAAPADPVVEECLQKAFDLAQTAEKKTLDDADLDKLEKMLGEMETHCDAKETAEADKIGGEIQAMLDSKQ
ncbi:MAG: hypothetical protein KDJ45_10950 [Hyphomicrobiaceae bacterium]|nr:hypothetical protein [Hyphomicrobiaceae bacterium]